MKIIYKNNANKKKKIKNRSDITIRQWLDKI